MAKLLLILLCCFIWVEADPFFFNFQNSYASQPTQSSSRSTVSQSSNIGFGGVFSKWLIGPQILTYKFFGVPTQRPRPTQRPVVQIDPIYVPVDLDKEYASTTSTEVPAEEIGSTKKSTTSTTSSYEYTRPSTTERTTTSFSYTESSSSTSQNTESSFSTSQSTTEAETIKPTTYRPITSSSTQTSTTTTSTTEISETEIGYEIDSTEDKTNEIKEPSTTSTTTEEYTAGVETTEAAIPLPLTYLPPVVKGRKLAGASISSGVLSESPVSTDFTFSGAAQGELSASVTSSDSSSTSVNSGNAGTFGTVVKSRKLAAPSSLNLASTGTISSGVLSEIPVSTDFTFSGAAQGELPASVTSSDSSSTSVNSGNAGTFGTVVKSRKLAAPSSLNLASTGTISSGVLSETPVSTDLIFSGPAQGELSAGAASSVSSSTSVNGRNARPFDIISFRGTIADDIAGEGLIRESKSTEVDTNGIDPRVFYYY